MTDQFTYLNQRMKHLEARVKTLERVVRQEPGGSEKTLPAPSSPEPPNTTIPDGDGNMTRTLLWSIYDSVTRQLLGGNADHENIVAIKRRQESIEQTISEIRDGVQTLLARTS